MDSKLAILNIGGELLDGRTVNSNAQYFAQRLHEMGITVSEVLMVEDTIESITEALHYLNSYQSVLVTGGLGPTSDDCTSAAAAHAFQIPRKFLPAAERIVRRQLGNGKQKYTALQKSQALLPQGSQVLDNHWGIAPGFSYLFQRTRYYFLPGVPRECRPMFDANVLPLLTRKLKDRRMLSQHLWRCFGKKEAELYRIIASIIEPLQKKYASNFYFSCLIPYPSVDIRIAFWQEKGKPTPSVSLQKRVVAQIDQKLGDVVYTKEPITLAEVVLRKLVAIGKTVATAESCTGGLVGKLLTDAPGSSKVYRGGTVCYANAAKETLLGVRPSTLRRYGAVSKETALEMAQGIQDSLQSDYAISISGVAGPDGGSAQKPVGTIFIGFAAPDGLTFKHHVIVKRPSDRAQIRAYASHLALDMLRRTVEKN